jgi:hypothetical protein
MKKIVMKRNPECGACERGEASGDAGGFFTPHTGTRRGGVKAGGFQRELVRRGCRFFCGAGKRLYSVESIDEKQTPSPCTGFPLFSIRAILFKTNFMEAYHGKYS